MQHPSEYQQFQSSIAGRFKKYVTKDGKSFLKEFGQSQLNFYLYMGSLTTSHPTYQLVKFLPYFQKVTTIQQRNYMMFKNFKLNYSLFNGIDIKLGKRRPQPQNAHKPIIKLNFFIDGLKIHLQKPLNQQSQSLLPQLQPRQSQKISLQRNDFKKLLQNDQDYKNMLTLLFFDRHQMRVGLLKRVIQKLRQFILAIKSLKNWINYHSSICIFYDPQNDNNFDIKFIDFQKSHHTGSEQLQNHTQILGLQNLHRFLMEIMQQHNQFNSQTLLRTISEYQQVKNNNTTL